MNAFLLTAAIAGAIALTLRCLVYLAENSDDPTRLSAAAAAQMAADTLLLLLFPLLALGGHSGWGLFCFLFACGDGTEANKLRKKAAKARRRQRAEQQRQAEDIDRLAEQLGLPPTPRVDPDPFLTPRPATEPAPEKGPDHAQ